MGTTFNGLRATAAYNDDRHGNLITPACKGGRQGRTGLCKTHDYKRSMRGTAAQRRSGAPPNDKIRR